MCLIWELRALFDTILLPFISRGNVDVKEL
jgi:hypothetical protein